MVSLSGRAQQGRSQGEAQGGKKRRATPGRGVGGGACRAVPQEVPVEDFDAVAVVQSLVLPNSVRRYGRFEFCELCVAPPPRACFQISVSHDRCGGELRISRTTVSVVLYLWRRRAMCGEMWKEDHGRSEERRGLPSY